MIYLIGSLRNPEIPRLATELRRAGLEVFDDWYAAGAQADDAWRDYEKGKGNGLKEALQGHSATHTFNFDRYHFQVAHGAVAVYPLGKSGHMELGFVAGSGKPVFALLDKEPDRFDVMQQFAIHCVFSVERLLHEVKTFHWPHIPTVHYPTHQDAMWLAGLLEGEGSFCISGSVPRLVLQMTDHDIVVRAAKLLGSSVWNKKPYPTRKEVFSCGRAGISAVEWMRVLKPYMGERRRGQIVRTVDQWLQRKTHRHADDWFWKATIL